MNRTKVTCVLWYPVSCCITW